MLDIQSYSYRGVCLTPSCLYNPGLIAFFEEKSKLHYLKLKNGRPKSAALFFNYTINR